MLVEFVVMLILGVRQDWRPDACDHEFASDSARLSCEARRDSGREWAERLAGYIAEESERWTIPSSWIVALIKQESDFGRGDVCEDRVPVARIESRRVIDADKKKEMMCWYRSSAATRRNCQPVIITAETPDHVDINRCAAGEHGLMQVSHHEARAGTVVQATGEPLPRSSRERHDLMSDPQINISLGVAAIAHVRDLCCHTDDCRADPSSFLGAYNCGSCRSRVGQRYTERLERHRRKALAYACGQMPDNPECEGFVE